MHSTLHEDLPWFAPESARDGYFLHAETFYKSRQGDCQNGRFGTANRHSSTLCLEPIGILLGVPRPAYILQRFISGSAVLT